MLALAGICAVATAHQPIAVLDVLRQTTNGNSTSFVLYDDGLVIFVPKSASSSEPYFSVQLTKRELENISPPSSLLSLKREYITFNASDVPAYRLLFSTGGHRKVISVLGFLQQTGEWYPGELSPLPNTLDTYLGKIIGFSNSRAKAWPPNDIQVEIASQAPVSPPFQWPEAWPDIHSPTSVKFKWPEDWYCLTLPGNGWPALHHLAGALGDDGTFLMDGKTWSIVHMRFILPEEKRWQPIGACHPDTESPFP